MYRIPTMRKVPHLIPHISTLLSLPEDQISKLVSHHYKSLKEQLSNPTSVLIQYEFFGKIVLNDRALRKYITTFVLPNYRANPNDSTRKYLMDMLELRRLARNFRKYKSKDVKRKIKPGIPEPTAS